NQIPVTWDETRFVTGTVGKTIVLARRKGREWYVGAIVDREAHSGMQVPLEFLGDTKIKWSAEILTDAPDSNVNATHILKVQRSVHARDTLTLDTAPAGGFVVRLSY